ncbi:MAG: proteasome assembly chaperone family protein [Nanoarchaeota archaeon]|nr:proteasome assembly chaperone family protein [Nanoarchaeota archaeon]
MNVEIVVEKPIPRNAIILEGFQGVGLVGTLAAQYIADQQNAEIIGYVDVPEFPPIAILVNGKVREPIRIYKFKKGTNTFVVFESELPIPQKFVNSIAREIANFAKKNKVKEIISLEGLAVPKSPSESKVYWISNNKSKFEKKFKSVQLLKSGIVIGVSAALLIQSKTRKVPAAVLMAEAHADFPDGMAAASLIKAINKIYGLNVDVEPLEKESKRFEEKVWQIIEKAKQLKQADERPNETYIG